MISDLEIQHLFETAFLPDKCICTVRPHSSISVQVYDQASEQLLLTVTGISRIEMASSRSIANLVGELREEIRLRAIANKDRTISRLS